MSPGDPSPPNPNPYSHQLVRQKQVRNCYLVEVKFPGCTTFDGHKILLMTVPYCPNTALDPRLLGDDHPVIARFVPTRKGWLIAEAAALTWSSFGE